MVMMTILWMAMAITLLTLASGQLEEMETMITVSYLTSTTGLLTAHALLKIEVRMKLQSYKISYWIVFVFCVSV